MKNPALLKEFQNLQVMKAGGLRREKNALDSLPCTSVDEKGTWHWNQGEATVFTVSADMDGLEEFRN